MKEHQDDVLVGVKKSSPSVDSTTADQSVTERGKIEGFLGERDEGEDMMVDVVGGDGVVDGHGGSKVHLDGKVGLNGSVEAGSERDMVTRDQVMEDGVAEVVRDAVVGSKDLTLEKVEVVVSEESVNKSVEVVSKAVVQENAVTAIASGSDCDVQKSGNGAVVVDSKMASEPSGEVSERDLTKEIVELPTESVLEVADGDHVMDDKIGKEVDALNSSKIPESLTTTENLGSPKGCVVAGEEGLAGKDKCEDGVTNQSLSTDVVDAGKEEDNVHVTTKNLDHQAGVDQLSTESLQSTAELTATDVQKSGNGTQVGDSKTSAESLSAEPSLVERESIVQKEESERGLTKETLERPVESVQEVVDVDCVMNEKTVQDDVLNSPKVLEPVTNDGVVVESLAGKNKAQDAVLKDLSSKCPDNPSFPIDGVNVGTDVVAVHENAGNLDQKAAVDQTSKEESSHSTIEVRRGDSKKSGTGTMVGDSKMDDESASKDLQITEGKDKEEGTERTSAVEIVEQPLGSVQEVADGNHVMNEKTTKEDESLTTSFLGSEEVVEGLEGKDKAQDDVSVKQSAICPDNQSLASEFSYEEAHMERGEDAGMDIDEVLGWKDEIPGIDASSGGVICPEKDQNANSEADVVQQEDLKSQQPIMYERRLHVEVPLHDALEKSSSPRVKDENLKVETQCGNSKEIKVETTHLSSVDEKINEDADEHSDTREHTDFHRNQEMEDSSVVGEGAEQVISDGQQVSEKKERSLPELTVDATYSGDGAQGIDENINSDLVSSPGSKKRKALDSISDDSEKRPSLHTETVTPATKPSFKIGACIQRVASQLTGPPSVLKSGSDKNAEPTDQPAGVAGSVQSPGHAQLGRLSNQVYPSDMLSQLHLAAQDPMKGYNFLNTIIPFFHSHRASVLSKSLRQTSSAGRPTDPRKRKMSNENDPEEFEFDDVNDSYWTDRVIQNYSEEQSLQDNQNGGGENQVVPYEQDKPVKPIRRSNKKRFFSSNHEIEAKEQSELIERRRQNLATEVLMKFAEGIYFPSEIHLNKMFKRFGPLMESETEVDRQSGRARVVFKKCSDAEVAHSSAGRFNIFGSISVNYELNYTPLISYKPLPLPLAQDPADAC